MPAPLTPGRPLSAAERQARRRAKRAAAGLVEIMVCVPAPCAEAVRALTAGLCERWTAADSPQASVGEVLAAISRHPEEAPHA